MQGRFKLPTETKKTGEEFVPLIKHTAGPKIEEHWLPLAGGRMRYLKAGLGRPLILVHGLLGYSFSWRFTMPALVECSTVYALDNLGAGLSPSVPGMDCTMGATAERVLQFADALNLDEFDVLGTSHGGAVAMFAAAICAERGDSRLRRLILVDPVNPWSRHGMWLAPAAASAPGQTILRATIARSPLLDRLWLRRMFGDAAKIPPDSLEGYRIPVRENHSFEHAVRIVSTWTDDMKALEAAIPKIAHYPTLLMWGTRDRIVPFSSAEPLRRSFHNARLVAFEGAGHLPYEECPLEFNRALIEFVCG